MPMRCVLIVSSSQTAQFKGRDCRWMAHLHLPVMTACHSLKQTGLIVCITTLQVARLQGHLRQTEIM